MIIKKSFIKKTLIKNLINQVKNVKIVVICIPLRLVYLIITQKLSTSVFTSFLLISIRQISEVLKQRLLQKYSMIK